MRVLNIHERHFLQDTISAASRHTAAVKHSAVDTGGSVGGLRGDHVPSWVEVEISLHRQREVKMKYMLL